MVIREKHLKERTHKYGTQDLMDKVEQSLLTDESKSILIDLIANMSIQYGELYHHLSRQSLAVDIYRTYSELNNKFALFIFGCVSSEAIDNAYVNHQINNQIGLLHTLCEKVCNVVKPEVFECIKDVDETAETYLEKFKNECNAIIVNNRNIYSDTNTDDFLKPRSYKYMVDLNKDEDEEELDNDPDFDIGEADTDGENNVRMISLKQNGLKIRPQKRRYRFKYL